MRPHAAWWAVEWTGKKLIEKLAEAGLIAFAIGAVAWFKSHLDIVTVISGFVISLLVLFWNAKRNKSVMEPKEPARVVNTPEEHSERVISSRLKVELRDGEPPRLVFKVREGSPPTKIRNVGPLISEEWYHTEQPLILLQSEIPEVEKGEPVECQFLGADFKRTLEAGGPMTLDSITIQYTCEGSIELYSSQFILHKNADGSIVFSTDKTRISPKDLKDLRYRLLLLKEAEKELTYVGMVETLADEARTLKEHLQAIHSQALNAADKGAQAALAHPLSVNVLDITTSLPWYLVELCKFHGLYNDHRVRVVNTKVLTVLLLKWAIGTETATYKEVLDAIYEHQVALEKLTPDKRRRYAAIAATPVDKATIS